MSTPSQASGPPPLVEAPVRNLGLPRTWCVVACQQGCAESWTVDTADFDPALSTGQVEDLLEPLLIAHEQEHTVWLADRIEVQRRFQSLLDEHDWNYDAAIEALLHQQISMERALVELCDNSWLRLRDRYMHLPGARPLRASAAGAIELAAHELRRVVQDAGIDRDTETYRQWMVSGRDGREATP